MTSPTWTVQPGETLVREQIHGVYGGNPKSGISRSSSTPNVLVYSDHEKAAANGYDFDGWNESQQVYYYTGEGKTGDQVMLRGNRAIAEHQADGTALRLFVAVGNRPAQALESTSMSANSQSNQNVLTSFAGHLAASSSTRARLDNGGSLSGNVSPFACSAIPKNPVPTGRYGRDGDAVW
jgi:hypothetical protein